ncbi:hypothetical protein R5R35_014705 [Gryllus longicercus]|uniref:Odorant binding protein n=1 Tax=Gryllus longicercus TaxID=2509291 RepID=A0AAN9VBM4_9ORTH
MRAAASALMLLVLVAVPSMFGRGLHERKKNIMMQKCLDDAGIDNDGVVEILDSFLPENKIFWCCLFKKFNLVKEDGARDTFACEGKIDTFNDYLEDRGVNIPEVKWCCSVGGDDCGQMTLAMVQCAMPRLGPASFGVMKFLLGQQNASTSDVSREKN